MKNIYGNLDLVILIALSKESGECLKIINESINKFVCKMVEPDEYGRTPLKDWRIKAVGLNGSEAKTTGWLTDNPFVENLLDLQAQFSNITTIDCKIRTNLIPFLEALIYISSMNDRDENKYNLNARWRPKSAANRGILFLTDQIFAQPISLEWAPECDCSDIWSFLSQFILEQRIVLGGLAPEWEGYLDLCVFEDSFVTLIPNNQSMFWSNGDEIRKKIDAALNYILKNINKVRQNSEYQATPAVCQDLVDRINKHNKSEIDRLRAKRGNK